MDTLQGLSLADLRARAVETFRQGGGSRPDVLLVKLDGALAVLKDFSAAAPAFRRVFGARFIAREAQALDRLRGVDGVPRLIGTIEPYALVMEYVEGRHARSFADGELNGEFFTRFDRLLSAMHACGIAHCDLRSRGNILVDKDGRPYTIDFTAHFAAAPRWNPFRRWAFRQFCLADRVAVARLKRRHAPELLTAAEQAGLRRDKRSALERAARIFGKTTRFVVRSLFSGRSSLG